MVALACLVLSLGAHSSTFNLVSSLSIGTALPYLRDVEGSACACRCLGIAVVVA